MPVLTRLVDEGIGPLAIERIDEGVPLLPGRGSKIERCRVNADNGCTVERHRKRNGWLTAVGTKEVAAVNR